MTYPTDFDNSLVMHSFKALLLLAFTNSIALAFTILKEHLTASILSTSTMQGKKSMLSSRTHLTQSMRTHSSLKH